jgi:hypothetical protein
MRILIICDLAPFQYDYSSALSDSDIPEPNEEDTKLNYSTDNSGNNSGDRHASGKSVADSVKRNKRTKVTPAKYKSPLAPVKLRKRSANTRHEHTSSIKKGLLHSYMVLLQQTNMMTIYLLGIQSDAFHSTAFR